MHERGDGRPSDCREESGLSAWVEVFWVECSELAPPRCQSAIYQAMRETDIDWDCNPWPDQVTCRNFCQSILRFCPQDARPLRPTVLLALSTDLTT